MFHDPISLQASAPWPLEFCHHIFLHQAFVKILPHFFRPSKLSFSEVSSDNRHADIQGIFSELLTSDEIIWPYSELGMS